MDIKVVIAMHKPYTVPKDEMYVPLHVGAEGKSPLDVNEVADNTGDNISKKNATYCELTGLYWAWKNLEADAIGLVHYRRHFTLKKKAQIKVAEKKNQKMKLVLTKQEAEGLLEFADVIVPTKRKYYIESLYSHYAHTLDGKHLDLAREIIAEKYPEYLAACDTVYQQTWGYMFNMCIMKRPVLDEYCPWLFSVLEELETKMEKETKGEEMTAFEARIYGRVSEILFNVWLVQKQKQTEKPFAIAEVRTMHMEPVNWAKKGGAFLQAKFFGKKYSKSF